MKIVDEINEEITNLCSLQFDRHELNYLRTIRYLKLDYIDFLRLMKLSPDHIKVKLVDNRLDIRIKGSWLFTILFEVPVLAIVNEIYNKHTYPKADLGTGRSKLIDKFNGLTEADLHFSEFGTRRRFSREWHEEVIKHLAKFPPNMFMGTSNVLFAMRYKLKPIGTMAHEFIQCGQAVGVRLIDSQKRMLQAWVDEYRGDLGYALTDTLGIDAFLKDFDLYFAKLYDGVRQDSGNPFEWARKMLDHYSKLGINSKDKYFVFSDSLDIPLAVELTKTFGQSVKVSCGIGTNLTNDIEGVNPLNIVIKVVKCNGQPVAKISDSLSKGMCEDLEYVQYLKKTFAIKG